VILSGLFALWFYRPFKIYRPFFWAFFFTLLIFMYFKAKDYYAIGLYPIYIAFGSVFIGKFISEGWTKYLQPLAIAVPIVIFYPMSLIVFPNKSPEYIKAHPEKYLEYGLLRWEDGRNHELPQDFADMLGWSELAQKVDAIYSKLPNKDQTLIMCDNYGQAGAINYYTRQGIKAVSFNADYINWFDLDKDYKNFIRIKEYRLRDEDELAKTSPYFETSKLVDSIANPNAREFRTRIFVFTGANIDVSERIAQEIENRKKSQ
jgi:energy-coupling factor transporter transmembrane protein EcfT